MIDVRHLIGGEWVAGAPAFDVIACDDGSVLARVARGRRGRWSTAPSRRPPGAALPAWKAPRAPPIAPPCCSSWPTGSEANIEPLAQLDLARDGQADPPLARRASWSAPSTSCGTSRARRAMLQGDVTGASPAHLLDLTIPSRSASRR